MLQVFNQKSKLIRTFFSFLALTLGFPVMVYGATLNGYVDSVSKNAGKILVYGWACAEGKATPIKVSVRVDNGKAGEQTLAEETTNQTSDENVGKVCKSKGTKFRFGVDITKLGVKFPKKVVKVYALDGATKKLLPSAKAEQITIP